jgi:hypothetical protein
LKSLVNFAVFSSTVTLQIGSIANFFTSLICLSLRQVYTF